MIHQNALEKVEGVDKFVDMLVYLTIYFADVYIKLLCNRMVKRLGSYILCYVNQIEY